MNQTKIVLLGEAQSGKSTYVKKMLTVTVNSIYIPTLGAEVYSHNRFVLWDTAGKDDFSGLASAYYIEADAALLFIDASTVITKRRLNHFVNNFKAICPNKEIVVLISKMDQSVEEYVNFAVQYAQENNLRYYGISTSIDCVKPERIFTNLNITC